MRERDHTGRMIKTAAAIIIFAALVLLAFRPAIIKAQENARWRKANESGYQQAVELYRQGAYEKADKLFGTLDYHYSHVKEYRMLCDAHRYYDAGNMHMAKISLDRYTYSFLSTEEKEELETFRSAVEQGYAAYEAEEAYEEQQMLEERILTEPPFYGMPESRIKDTILGEYSKLETTTNGNHLEQWEVHNCSWISGGKTLYYVSCEKGRVVCVYDYRDHPKSPAGSGVDISSYPDVSFFSNPEDFYYFYTDDFDGYQDAEDFYYEHGGQ